MSRSSPPRLGDVVGQLRVVGVGTRWVDFVNQSSGEPRAKRTTLEGWLKFCHWIREQAGRDA